MKNKIIMIINIIVILFCIQLIQGQFVYAAKTGADIISGADDFISKGKDKADEKLDPGGMKEASDMIYNILLSVGVVIAVGIAAVLGIKFMTGGIEEQVKVKESLLPFIVGCVILFGAFTIWKVVVLMTSNL